MEQIISWVVYAIIDYRELVRNVARETMTLYDFWAGWPDQNKHIFAKLTKGSNFLHLINDSGVSFYFYNALNHVNEVCMQSIFFPYMNPAFLMLLRNAYYSATTNTKSIIRCVYLTFNKYPMLYRQCPALLWDEGLP